MPDLDPTAVVVAILGVIGAWLGGGWLVNRSQRPERVLDAAQRQSAWLVEQVQEEYQRLTSEMASMRVELDGARTEARATREALAAAVAEIASLRVELAQRDAHIAQLLQRIGENTAT